MLPTSQPIYSIFFLKRINPTKLLTPRIIFIALLFSIADNSPGQIKDDTNEKEFILWLNENAISISTTEPGSNFDDLQPLKKIIGNARIVCLGESRHDVHEQFQFKHRMTEFLVKEMGFNCFAMEEGLPYVRKINDYIHGKDDNPETLLNGMGLWMIWDTKEVLELVKWMRKYNDGAIEQKKISFYGLDMCWPLLGLENVFLYLKKIDIKYFQSINNNQFGIKLFRDNDWISIRNRYAEITSEKKGIISQNIFDLISYLKEKREEYIKLSSEVDYEWALRQAIVYQQGHNFYVAMVEATYEDGLVIRDKALANNLQWLLRILSSDDRVIIWAHNAHLAMSELKFHFAPRPVIGPMVMMGQHLKETLEEEIITFGFSFNRGEFNKTKIVLSDSNMIDGVLAQVGLPYYMVDLRSIYSDTPAYHWLNQKRKMYGDDGYMECNLAKTYDVIVFFDEVSQTIKTKLAEQRLSKESEH